MGQHMTIGKPDTVGLVNERAWYTQQELLDIAGRRGHTVSQGLVEKWVGLGLLDQGTRKGRGQGRGAWFLWPDNQLQLFLVLLEKRSTVSRVRVLINLPVAVWVYWGEEYVPLRQVRRAMGTWADVRRPRARHNWNAMAKRIVGGIASLGSTRADREVAADLIADLARTRTGDVADLVVALEPVVGRENQLMFTDAPRAAEMLVAQVTALSRIQEIPDEIFRWARAVSLYTQADYIAAQPALARDPRFGSMHPSPTFDDFVRAACRNLIATLGLHLLHPSAPGLPSALDPELWKDGRAHMKSSASYQTSPLTLPPWVQGGNVRVDVHIEVDPE